MTFSEKCCPARASRLDLLIKQRLLRGHLLVLCNFYSGTSRVVEAVSGDDLIRTGFSR